MIEELEKERKRQVQLMLRGLQRRIDLVRNSAFWVLTPTPKIKASYYKRIQILKAFLVCYKIWSEFLTFGKHHAPSQIWELLVQWHIAEDMNATAVRTWHFPQIWKTRMSNVSAVVVSLTIRTLYPVWWHPLPINSEFLGRPQRRCGRFDQEFFNVYKCLLPCQLYIK